MKNHHETWSDHQIITAFYRKSVLQNRRVTSTFLTALMAAIIKTQNDWHSVRWPQVAMHLSYHYF